jgi:hypothetical protein
MNYCTIEDAWKNSDYISDQFKLYENPYQKKNIIENFDYNIKPSNVSENTNFEINNQQPSKTVSSSENQKPVIHNEHKSCNFTCDNFWEHLDKCEECRKKIRHQFSSKVVERVQNLILDNKDTIVLILMAIFILIFFNLLVSIFNK